MQYGVKISGITTHFANIDFDCGEIIHQRAINIDGLNFDEIDETFVKHGIEISIKTINSLKV